MLPSVLEMYVCFVDIARCLLLTVRWSSLSSMKNVDVAWRLIDVVREWQKLKKMTSMFLSE